ncbi:N-acetylmuramoyl-L-alanine amidase [Staphylococcus saprophyticus]|nr:N-acetylmuramoyl-L-alanine amidase [Staphylococcus saprophyticus]
MNDNDPGAENKEMKLNERDFIRKYIAPNVQKYLKQAGHTVDLYGGSKQDQNLYTDTAYGERIGDNKNYGMYWVHNQKYDVVVELHLDAASASATGGHVIISNQWPADKIDKDINNCLKATVGTIRAIDPRNDLLNANVSGRLNVNYRLVEMGFITNKKDMDYLKKNYDKFSKELAGAINGKPIGGTSAGSKKAKQTKWNWKGRFTPNTTIKVRTSPSLKGKVVSNNVTLFTKVKMIKFNFIVKADGYWWISYTSKGKTYYSAVCKITDKKERIKKEKYWGKLKWNWK